MKPDNKKISSLTYLVVGASRGIGRAVALELAKFKVNLILLSQNSSDLEKLDNVIEKISGKQSTLVPLDITNFNKIDEMAAAIFRRFKKIDGIFSGAAILKELSPISHTKFEDWNKILDTNLTSNFRLLWAFDPLLQKSKNANVIFCTSNASCNGKAYWGSYAASKAALESLTKTYALENKNTNVNVNIVNPGRVKTDLRAIAYPDENNPELKTPEYVANKIIPFLLPCCNVSGKVIDI